MTTTKKTPVKTPKKTVKKAAPKKAAKKATPKKVVKVEEPLCSNTVEDCKFILNNGYIIFQVRQKGRNNLYVNVHSFGFGTTMISCGVRQMNNLPKASFFEGAIFNNKLSIDERVEKFAKEFLDCLKTKAENERFTFVVASDYKNNANLFMDKISETSSSFSKNRNSLNQIKVWTIKI